MDEDEIGEAHPLVCQGHVITENGTSLAPTEFQLERGRFMAVFERRVGVIGRPAT